MDDALAQSSGLRWEPRVPDQRSEFDIAPAGSGMTAIAYGHGPVVVCIHGALGDYRQWDSIGSALRRNFRVVALSRRQHWPAQPSASAAAYSVESHRDDLFVLLRSIGERVHLVGHSYGALVALSAALADPALLRSLIVIEPPLHGLLTAATIGLEAELASRGAMVATMRSQIRAGDDRGASVTLIDWVQSGAGGFAALLEKHRAQLLDNAATIGPTYATPPPPLACAQLRDVAVPTLVLSGARTRLFYGLAAEATAACIPRARAAKIAQAGHMAIIDNPRATADAIRAFASGVDDARP
jgi:pimeloyl-ACP methyl ester carboxylesterase